MGRHGMGEINENGTRFVSFCSANNLVIGGTLFQHRNIHKYTWTSPDGHTKNQIDHMAVSRERRKSLIDVRTYRGADVASDHELVIGRVKLKLRAFKRTVSNIPRYDTSKLLNIEKEG